MKIRPVGTELFHEDGRKDRHKEANGPFSQFFQRKYYSWKARRNFSCGKKAEWEEAASRILLGDNVGSECHTAADQVPVFWSWDLNWTPFVYISYVVDDMHACIQYRHAGSSTCARPAGALLLLPDSVCMYHVLYVQNTAYRSQNLHIYIYMYVCLCFVCLFVFHMGLETNVFHFPK